MELNNYAIGFETQSRECAPTELEVHGTLPDWLTGRLLRSAPATFEFEEQAMNHWFDGMAMLFKFDIKGGRVTFQNKHLQSQAYTQGKAEGKLVRSEFGTDPCRQLFGKVMSFFQSPELSDNGNVTIGKFDGKYMAISETPLMLTFDPETLETGELYQYEDKLKGQVNPAHWLTDKQGNIYNYLLKFGMSSFYQIYKQSPGTHKREKIAELSASRPSYMHSFAMTEHYVILTENPYRVNPAHLKFGNNTIAEGYTWHPDQKSQFRIFDKQSGELVKTIETDPFFCFHHVKAFERDGILIVDLIAFDDPHFIDCLYLDNLRSNVPVNVVGTLTRFYLDFNHKKGQPVKTRVLCDTKIELPQFNSDFQTEEYRYIYGCGTETEGNFLDCIVKIDTHTGESSRWYHEDHYPSEPVFVWSPTPESEDDGVLLSVVLDVATKSTYLLVLDARDLSELARAEAPILLPFGFHGHFYPS